MTLNFSNLELTNKNILIVEDDVPSIRYYETILQTTGANVRIFRTGTEFIEYSGQKDHIIDLVIMDFLIPLVNGIDCVRTFRKDHKNIPVLMITAYSSEESKSEAFIAGCNEYILKPVYPEKIYSLKQDVTTYANYRPE